MMVLLWITLGLLTLWNGHALAMCLWQAKHEGAAIPCVAWLRPRPLLFATAVSREVLLDAYTSDKRTNGFLVNGKWMSIIGERFMTDEYYVAPFGWKAKVTRLAHLTNDGLWWSLTLTARWWWRLLHPVYVRVGDKVRRCSYLEYRVRQWFSSKES